MDRVIVVGGSIAAVRAVERLRDLGFAGRLTLVGAETHLPYDRPPLSKQALQSGSLAATELHDRAWYEERGIELLLGTPASALDPVRRELRVGQATMSYDGLVIATGAAPRRSGPVASSPLVHMLRTVDDFAAVHDAVIGSRRLCIVGAGFIGLEIAAAARARGVEVVVLENDPVPLYRHLGSEAGAWVAELHAAHGVDLRCGARVSEVHGKPGAVRVETTDGGSILADAVVAGVGVAPATDWLAGSGLDVDAGVVCDATLRTSAPGVVAAGDVARWRHELYGRHLRVEHWTTAAEQGWHAAATLLGHPEPYAAVPFVWSDQWSANLRFVGSTEGADRAKVLNAADGRLEVVYGTADRLVGALCVNSAKRLVAHRAAIAAGTAWADLDGL
ncbi:NAD(P)/FAD-dependent oxidoreductase [Nocardioides humi]|uniref:FAD/NAD(P)-binding oxidoreductase n=1 Tax=Nocardioides humi TaxID=449461 RepID=A0ABN2ADK4_9ACTN|nr:FAD-dependent oxidoreductase [Nocardioides humi]